VDLDLLRIHVESLTERQWWAAVREFPPRLQPAKSSRHSRHADDDLSTVPDDRFDPASAVYLQELLSIFENNLMAEDVPYFRAVVEKTSPKELAAILGVNPNTAWRRMRDVRLKVQSIIKAIGNGVSS